MTRFTRALLIAIAFGTCPGPSLWAQFRYPYAGDSFGLAASATETIQVKPQRLRLVMWVKAQGADAKTAVKALADHKARVKKELVAMSAEAESVIFSATRLTTGDGEDSSRVYARMQMMQNNANPNANAMPKVYTATSAVKAEWPLPIQEGDALALLPATLQDQIAARDLAGDKNKPELDAAAAEQLEEMQTMIQEEYGYYDSGDEAAGPQILFVAEVPEEELQRATQAAHAAAVKKALALAAATGTTLGRLTSLTSSGDVDYDYSAAYYSGYGDRNQLPAAFTSAGENAVTSVNVDQLVKTVTVSVSFAIE